MPAVQTQELLLELAAGVLVLLEVMLLVVAIQVKEVLEGLV
jgi:hypothetical protein